ncbi:hypothetical protein EV132_13035 [Rhizobium sullae]|uniref:Uncharacterized protein n=1 Tax=Rhizobium sullae TaxID=50338 RepID=A0A4R3PWP4_RHISU|nr:hypothetical protein EV132_13035 [Rhizobium sullae]
MRIWNTLLAISGHPPRTTLLCCSASAAFLASGSFFFNEGRTEARLNGDPVHDRGAYLVETLGNRADCHSTRDVLGAIKASTRFAGGSDPEATGFAPNITPSKIGHWSEHALSVFLFLHKHGLTE